ncbi:hypothetical protein [Marinobacter shengliensis]|uniref:hypothetical protein n=1 Tax=Marinobacter shengliensis TaxID=1389223 RepID=UPI0011082C77|nr:hypothetical protein [Marinobacter shengliensis]
MKHLWIVAALFFTGCAQTPVELSRDVTLQPWHSAQSIRSVRFPAQSSGGDLEFCTAKNVVNPSVTFADSSDSFFGAFTGTYYSRTDSTTVGGGGVIQHSSDKGVIAVGVTSYEVSALVKRYVRFQLTATTDQYEFENIEQVQANSGAAPNNGFHPVGDFSGANPKMALDSLEEIARNIDYCRNL